MIEHDLIKESRSENTQQPTSPRATSDQVQPKLETSQFMTMGE